MLVLALIVFGLASGQESRVDFTPEELSAILELSPLPDPPGDPTNRVYEDPRAARLGQALFFEKRLSGPGTVSCATCHDPALSWTDGKPLATAVGTFPRNSMTLWNAAYNRWFFWDGRKDTLWSQALAPLEDPREHAGSRLQYVHFVLEDPDYRRAYSDVFGEPPDLSDPTRFPPEGRPVPGSPDHPHEIAWTSMTAADRDTVNRVFSNLGKAIAAFERRIVSRNAPFDEFVAGLREGSPEKQRALAPAARRGLELFLGKARCILCHNGPNFTDLEFHNDRVPDPASEGVLDPGRFAGIDRLRRDPFNAIGAYSDDPTGPARDKTAFLLRTPHNQGEFKTPTLRNVARTAPYMHAGQFATLDEVLQFYSTLEGALPIHKGAEKLLVPVHLDATERADLIAFLESLTDETLPAELLGPPATPWLPEVPSAPGR